MDELKSNSVREYLDGLPSHLKKTGVSATFEITAYPDGHAAIGTHPLNGREELLQSVAYLWERLQDEAEAARQTT